MRVLYHAAPKKLRRRILREGLTPRELGSDVTEVTGLTRGIYLDTSLDEAAAWSGMLSLRDIPEGVESYSAKYDVFRVNLPDEAVLVPDPETFDIGQAQSSFITATPIPARNIRYIDTIESLWG